MVYHPDAELADPEEIAERVILGIATSLALQSGELPGLFEDAGSIPTRWSQADENAFLAGFNEDVLGILRAETSNTRKESIETGKKSGKMNIGIQLFAEKDIAKQESASLKKALGKYEARIAEHQQKIKNRVYTVG